MPLWIRILAISSVATAFRLEQESLQEARVVCPANNHDNKQFHSFKHFCCDRISAWVVSRFSAEIFKRWLVESSDLRYHQWNMLTADDNRKVLTLKKVLRAPSPWLQSLLVTTACFLNLRCRDRWWVLPSGEGVLQLQRRPAFKQWSLDGSQLEQLWLQEDDLALLTEVKLRIFQMSNL